MAENQVKVNQADAVPNYLYPKLQAGHGISLKNNGSNIRIDALGNPGDRKVLVDSADEIPGFLAEKIEAGTGVTLNNTGSAIQINANTQSGDHKVIVDSSDTSPDYLDEKIKAGTNVSITNQGTYLEISSTDTGMLNPMTTAGDLIVGGASGDPDRLGVGTDGQVLTTDNGAVAWKTPATQTGDHKVIVDSSDTNPQYLGVKLKSGAGVNISYYNHDKMEIASLGQVKVALLGTMDYLGNKILQGSGITLTKTDNDITIAADTQTGDHKVLASSGDSTPDYLGNKLVQGSGITLTKGTNDVTIAADTQTGDHLVLATSADSTSAGALADKIYVFSPLVQSTATAGGVQRFTMKIGAGTAGQVLTSVSDGLGNVSASWASPAVQTGDHKVVIDGNDTSPDYLASKLVQGTGITLTSGASDITVAFDNPMTTSGDLIVGGTSGALTRLAKGYQGQVLKVGTNGLEWGADIGFANPMEERGDLIVGTYDGVASRLPIGTANQFLISNGTTAEWGTLPLNIDWASPPALANGEFNQAINRTFYLRVYPSMQMRVITHVVTVLSGAVTADVIRAAVYDSSRTMVAYGESTSSSSTFRRISLTQLQPWTPDTDNYYYLGISIRASSNANTKIKTISSTNPSFCWHEDVALTSGRAMPAISSLTAVTNKIPVIGLRGR